MSISESKASDNGNRKRQCKMIINFTVFKMITIGWCGGIVVYDLVFKLCINVLIKDFNPSLLQE